MTTTTTRTADLFSRVITLAMFLTMMVSPVAAFRTPDNVRNKINVPRVNDKNTNKPPTSTTIDQELIDQAIATEKPSPLRWLVDRAHEHEYWHK